MKPLRSWILTAFEPFLQREFNQSERVLQSITQIHRAAKRDFTIQIHTQLLPTEYDRCEIVLLSELDRIQKIQGPVDAILSIGEGREDFKIETQANNMDHAPNTADNAGVIRNRHKIIEHQPETIPLEFPFESFELERSLSPGFYVCNHLCARMASRQRTQPEFPKFGFIHVPRLEFNPHWSTEQCAQIIYRGIERAANFVR